MEPSIVVVDLKALRSEVAFKRERTETEKDLIRLMDPKISNPGFATKLKVVSECTVVTNACGSCSFGNSQGYLIEYYCNGTGSDPDFARCETC